MYLLAISQVSADPMPHTGIMVMGVGFLVGFLRKFSTRYFFTKKCSKAQALARLNLTITALSVCFDTSCIVTSYFGYDTLLVISQMRDTSLPYGGRVLPEALGFLKTIQANGTIVEKPMEVSIPDLLINCLRSYMQANFLTSIFDFVTSFIQKTSLGRPCIQPEALLQEKEL